MAKSNLAYDFARFEQNAAKAKPKQEAQIKRVEKTRQKKAFRPVLFMAGLLTVLAITASMIYSGMRLNEVTSQINESNKLLQELENENIRQTLEMESRLSMQSVEDAALAMGLQKMDNSQVRYISLSEGNRIEVTDGKDETVVEKIKGIFDRFMEYIGN